MLKAFFSSYFDSLLLSFACLFNFPAFLLGFRRNVRFCTFANGNCSLLREYWKDHFRFKLYIIYFLHSGLSPFSYTIILFFPSLFLSCPTIPNLLFYLISIFLLSPFLSPSFFLSYLLSFLLPFPLSYLLSYLLSYIPSYVFTYIICFLYQKEVLGFV